ncbi:MAG: nucleotidyltransferase domain-containing protein [Spirochaetes bacterium]|nr:nucleotidyltransferase domain-containing protein [Spirochaetota bacterium]
MTEIKAFLKHSSEILSKDERIRALCAGGSWITGETDSFSDLDLVIVTETDISGSKNEMIRIASSLGSLCSGFTGEHVGENRLLICLYENPVLHVDLKFVKIEDLYVRVENPVIIWERDNVVTEALNKTSAEWPFPDLQWIEDRFWVWIHYAATKLGRGEYFETIDFISFLRTNVLGPLYHIRYDSLPRGVRKLEFILNSDDLNKLRNTVPSYSFDSIRASIFNIIDIYKELQNILFTGNITRLSNAEKTGIEYLKSIRE